MPDTPIHAALTPEEWHLVSSLRALPPSPLKERTTRLLRELVAFIEEPRCAEMQADGVPCNTAHAHCDQCVHVAGMIDAMERRATADA